MTRVLPVLLVFAGCQGPRLEQTERDIETLRSDVDALNSNVDNLLKNLRRRQHAASTAQTDQNPEGFDGTRALPAPDKTRPDIILLSIDTLRADHLGSYGYERDTSPFLDSLASDGTRFADVWSAAPWTLPSHTTILSGLLPNHHGAVEDNLRIGDDIALVQEAFGSAGYGTAGVVATLFVSRRFGFDRGFDYFHDFEIAGARLNNASTVDAEHVFNHALHWAQQQEDGKPLFLFLHVYDVHYGYNAPPPFNTQFDRAAELGDPIYKEYSFYRRNPLGAAAMAHQIAQYDEEIAYVDHAFQGLMDKWAADGREAIVMVTSDHGEELGERGSWGHAHTLFAEQLHVPWIVHGPGIRSQTVRDRVGSEDMASTLAGLAHLDFPAADGVNRAQQVRTGARPVQAHPSARYAETSRFDTLRYRWHGDGHDMMVDLNAGKRGLCKLGDPEDPDCKQNTYRANAELGDRLFAEMVDFLGDPWEALAPGSVQVKTGWIYTGVERQKKQLDVEPGDTFSVHPADAQVSFTAIDGAESGPFSALGGTLPDDTAPLAFHGRKAGDTSVSLTGDEKDMLEELGYIQD